MKAGVKIDLSSLKVRWPSSICARTEVPSFSGGIVSEKYLANMDSSGKGPKNRFRLGRKIVYHVDDLVEWLESRASELTTHPVRNFEK